MTARLHTQRTRQRDQASTTRGFDFELEELRQDRDRERVNANIRDRGNGIRRGPEPRIRVLASDVDSWSRHGACSLGVFLLLAELVTSIGNSQHVDYVRYNFAMNFALFETRSGNVPVAVRRSTWRLRGARRVAFVLQIQDTTHSPVTLVDRATHRAAAPAARRLGPALLSCSGSGQRAARQQRGHTVQLYS
jgi:hypothetical protein